MHKFVKTLLVVWLLVLVIFIGSLIGYLIANYKTNKEANVTQIIEDKPSYEYLKSITVLIQGVGKYPPDISEETRKNFRWKYDIDSENGEPVSWLGTGVIVKITDKYTYILTNAHVVGNDMIEVTIFVENGLKKQEATIIKVHNNLDMALIRINGKIKDKTEVKGIVIPNPQDKVYLVGHHLGNPYIYGEGVFAGYSGIYDIIQIPCLWGNSGSGVINKDGKLVGLVFAIPMNMIYIFPVFDVSHAIVIDGLSIQLFLGQIEEIK
jgi:S1-C subfamily serine protease